MPIGPSVPPPSSQAKTSVVERFLQWCCRHEFSWPHTGAHGKDYQTCLNCGAIFEFDCNTMTRTGRQLSPPTP